MALTIVAASKIGASTDQRRQRDAGLSPSRAENKKAFDAILQGLTSASAVMAPSFPVAAVGPLIMAVAGISEGVAKDGLTGALAAIGFKPTSTLCGKNA